MFNSGTPPACTNYCNIVSTAYGITDPYINPGNSKFLYFNAGEADGVQTSK